MIRKTVLLLIVSVSFVLAQYTSTSGISYIQAGVSPLKNYSASISYTTVQSSSIESSFNLRYSHIADDEKFFYDVFSLSYGYNWKFWRPVSRLSIYIGGLAGASYIKAEDAVKNQEDEITYGIDAVGGIEFMFSSKVHMGGKFEQTFLPSSNFINSRYGAYFYVGVKI